MADKMRRVTVRVDPYKRLGELVKAARLAKIDPETGKPYPKTGAAIAAGLNRNTWGKVEVEQERASEATYVQIETFLGWEAGSIMRYLDDDGPEPGPRLVTTETSEKGHTLLVHYEGSELSDDDKARIEELVSRLARGQ